MLVKENFEQESGRSMVEMLGVLAIIGVLSVGGISGYTTAINKHKANEILNAAAIRAMAVSSQLQSGVDPATAVGSIASGEKVGDAELSGAQKVGDDKFKLVFTSGRDNVSEAVCKQMLNIAGTGGVVGIDSACERLLYHDDMSPGVDGSDTDPTNRTNPQNRDEYGECKEGLSGADCDQCPSGQNYVVGDGGVGSCESAGPSCPNFASDDRDATGFAGGSFNWTDNGVSLTCYCPDGKKYNTTTSQCDTNITTSCTEWKTNECGKGKYCDFSGIYSCADSTSNPYSPGTCKEISSANENLGDQAAGHWYLASDMNQWTANSWCIGKGRPGLIKFSTLSTIVGEGTTIGDGYSNYNGNGPLYTGFCGTGTTTTCLPGYGYWTDEDYPDDSCRAYGVGVSSLLEGVSNYLRNGNLDDTYALCD